MAKKLKYAFGIEYDFRLRFMKKSAPELGAVLKSPVTDDFGQVVSFSGMAQVVAMDFGVDANLDVDVYVKQYID